MLDQQEIRTLEILAKEYGYDAASLLAIIQVESAGRAFAQINGEILPLIRFEGHWFDRLLPPSLRETARVAQLSSPKPGAIRNPVTQHDRWHLLKRACAIDEHAALGATSWGVGQVMGFHWKALGFSSVGGLRDQACENFEGQMRLMLRFLSVNDLQPILARRDWDTFARIYNGTGYRKNNYHIRLAQAYEQSVKSLVGELR